MVPLTRENLLINLFRKWNEDEHVPVILVARTGLGTINHTLLSLEALWSRNIPVHGIVFVGDENEDNMRTIEEFSDVKVLGRLPMLDSLDAKSLPSNLTGRTRKRFIPMVMRRSSFLTTRTKASRKTAAPVIQRP